MRVQPFHEFKVAVLRRNMQQGLLRIRELTLGESLGACTNLAPGRVHVLLPDTFPDSRSIVLPRSSKDL